MFINNNFYSSGPKIAAIGGGTGLSVILRGLKKVTTDISAVVTVADDGGGSGMLRDDYGILPPGDLRNCILSLADEEDIMEQLLQYRFTDGRLAGQNMGNLFIAVLADIYGDFELAVEKLHDILRIKGHVIPVTTANVTLCAQLKNGSTVRGESRIPEEVRRQNSPIDYVFLDPPDVTALEKATNAILAADVIILGPGSLYSSIIPNLLVNGINSAIRRAGAMKVLICNIMTQPGETDDYTVAEYAHAVEKYIGKGVIEYMLVNNHRCTEEELQPYVETGTRQMCATENDRKELRDMGITLIENNMISVGDGYIRHDASRVSNIIMTMLHGV
jgi:uncharacterized cofD-like protein